MTRTIEDLPDLVVEQILSLLEPSFLVNDVQFVNKRWNGLIQGPSLWNSIRYIHLDNKKMGGHLIQKVLEKCHNLEHLAIINLHPLGSLHSLTFTKVCLPQLQSVLFHHNNLTMLNLILHIIEFAPLLQHFKFEGELTQALVDAISKLKHLTFIDLILYTRDIDLTELFKKCSKLEVIKVRADFKCHNINLATLLYHHSTTLKCLSWMTPIADNAVMFISRCTALSELGLDCGYLTDKSLKWIHEMSSLKCLILEHCRFFTSDALEQLFEDTSLPKLKRLSLVSLYFLNDLVLEAISRKYPNLETLDVESCDPPSAETFTRFPRPCGHIRILKLSQESLGSSLLVSGDHPDYLPSLTYHELDMSILRDCKKLKSPPT